VYTRQNQLYVEQADEVLLFVTAATDLQGFVGRESVDALELARQDLEEVSQKSWDVLYARHIEYYQTFSRRTELTLSNEEDNEEEKNLEERIFAAQKTGGDPVLDELYFNFCKYLFISSSREGQVPANLQGIWAGEIQTSWNGDWHFDAQQIIYWPAEVLNLSELHKPYLKLIESLQESGAKTAKKYYNARGWVVHPFTNVWGFTSPGEAASWGSTTGSSAWLCQHLWDHYLLSGDRDYLYQIYPVMKNAALFYLDMLIEEPKNHWLVTAPSSSPENHFYTEDGEISALCLGPTYDNQLLRYLFRACVTAARILDQDETLAAQLQETIGRLPPTRVGSDGRIMEWLEEYREPMPYHRHISHLWGVYPGDEISWK
jgi:alpha-L-fucosidase 2